MNAVTLTIQIRREGPQGIAFAMTREGSGDDMIEGHADFVSEVITGAVSGLRRLKGAPEEPSQQQP